MMGANLDFFLWLGSALVAGTLFGGCVADSKTAKVPVTRRDIVLILALFTIFVAIIVGMSLVGAYDPTTQTLSLVRAGAMVTVNLIGFVVSAALLVLRVKGTFGLLFLMYCGSTTS